MLNFKKFVSGILTLALASGFALAVQSPASATLAESYNFNTNGDLATYFDATVSSGRYLQSTSGGIADTGAINAPDISLDAVFASKAGYSRAASGSAYRFSSYIKSVGGGGYAGMGFSVTPSTAAGTPYRPSDALGISVHGGGFVFHNGSSNVPGQWATGGTGISSVTPYTGGGDLINSSTGWYKIIFVVTKATASTFNIRVEVWPANSLDGSLKYSSASAVYEVRGLTNSTIADAASIKSYINFSGSRVSHYDNFEVDLTGNASVVPVGKPVILTNPSSLSGNRITFNGEVISENGSNVTERGFVYSTSPNPTTDNTKIVEGAGTGTFSSTTGNLLPGTYYSRAYAINSAGTNYGSEEQTSIVVAPTISWTPSNTSAYKLAGSITPSVPASSDSSGAISYAVQNAGTTGCTVNSSTGVVSFTAAGDCVVRATVAAASPYSSGYVDKTFTVLANTVSGSPTSVSATAGNASATISWTAPASNGGSAITSYTVTASPGGATCSSSAPTTSCTVSGLTNGTAYTFTVTAANSTGTSLASGATTSVTPQAVTPTLSWVVTNTSAYALAGSVTPDAVAVSNSSGTITYAVQSAGSTGCTVNSSTGVVSFNSAGSCVIRASVSISAPYGAAYIDKTFTVNANTVANSPTNVVATAGNGAATISWAEPTSNGGSSISSYTVTASPGGSTCTVTFPTTTCEISGLTNGAAYTFVVTATNSTGTSLASSASSSITPSAPVVSAPAPSSSSPGPSAPVAPKPVPVPSSKVSSVDVIPGKVPGSSVIKLKLSDTNTGSLDSEVQIKLFDTKGKLIKVLTVPVTDATGSLQVELALPLGEFTVQASTVNQAGGASESVVQAAPLLQKSYFTPAVGNMAPVLAGTKVTNPIGFTQNSSVLSAQAKAQLLQIVSKLKSTNGKLALTGFSAKQAGTASYQKALATKRAKAVANFLKSQGISIPIYYSGYGSLSGAQSAGQPRKVELRLIK